MRSPLTLRFGLKIHHILALAWAILIVIVWLPTSLRSHIQMFAFVGWQPFAAHLTRIPALDYAADLALAIFGALVLALACLALGMGLLRVSRIAHASVGAWVATGFLLGEIACSLTFLTLLTSLTLTGLMVALFLVLGLITGIPDLLAFLQRPVQPRLPADFRQREYLALVLILVVFAASTTYSSARLSYDAVAEYFSHAKLMAVTGEPRFFYWKDPFVVSSLHPGILFTAAIQLFGDQSARLLSWLNGIAIAVLGAEIGRQIGLSGRGILWFLVILTTSTAFVDTLGDGKVDLFPTALILCAVFWLIRNFDAKQLRTYALTGTFAGFAMISRPHNGVLLGIFMLVLAIHLLLRSGLRHGDAACRGWARTALAVLIPVAGLSAYHLWQISLWLGDPLAPLEYAWTLSPDDWQWAIDPSRLVIYRLLYPLVVTFQNSPQSLGTVSPLFLAGLPMFLAVALSGKLASLQLRTIVLATVVTLSAWIWLSFAVVELRYVLFLWVLLFLLAAWALDMALESIHPRVSALFYLLADGLLVFAVVRTLAISIATYSPVDDSGQATCYDIPLCTFMDDLNRTAAPGDRVFVLNAYRYYLRPDLFACSSQSPEYAVLEPLARQNPTQFWAQLGELGFRYISFEQNFAQRHTRFGPLPAPASAPNRMEITLLSSSSANFEHVYFLERSQLSERPRVGCAQTASGTWKVSTATIQ